MREIEGIEEVVKTLKPHWEEIDAHFEKENTRFKELFANYHDSLGTTPLCGAA